MRRIVGIRQWRRPLLAFGLARPRAISQYLDAIPILKLALAMARVVMAVWQKALEVKAGRRRRHAEWLRSACSCDEKAKNVSFRNARMSRAMQQYVLCFGALDDGIYRASTAGFSRGSCQQRPGWRRLLYR